MYIYLIIFNINNNLSNKIHIYACKCEYLFIKHSNSVSKTFNTSK